MTITAKTIICGIIGHPVEHSLSPLMHNAAYAALDLPYVYVAFPVMNVKDALLGMKALSIRGLSVTIPHKIAAMEYVNNLDEMSKKIGAINTVVNDNGKLIGYNTDGIGAIKALEEKTSLTGKNVYVLGAGGAARAVVFGLMNKNAKVTILNRSLDRAKELGETAGAHYGDFSQIQEVADADIIIHATAVGMESRKGESIIPKEYLRAKQIVFDIVYTPKVTTLLKIAKERGCDVIYGYNMLLYQATEQFRLFTGHKAPIEVMRKVLEERLGK